MYTYWTSIPAQTLCVHLFHVLCNAGSCIMVRCCIHLITYRCVVSNKCLLCDMLIMSVHLSRTTQGCPGGYWSPYRYFARVYTVSTGCQYELFCKCSIPGSTVPSRALLQCTQVLLLMDYYMYLYNVMSVNVCICVISCETAYRGQRLHVVLHVTRSVIMYV